MSTAPLTRATIRSRRGPAIKVEPFTIHGEPAIRLAFLGTRKSFVTLDSGQWERLVLAGAVALASSVATVGRPHDFHPNCFCERCKAIAVAQTGGRP